MALDYSNPQKYIGDYESCYVGYSSDENIRNGAASGGIVSTLLIYLLENKYVDGVFVSRQYVKNGRIEVESFITNKVEEILDCRTSIYTFFPLEKNFKKLLEFKGKIAVVLLPCHLKTLNTLIIKNPELKEKVMFKISLFCGGVADEQLMYRILEKNNINVNDIERIYSRKGLWRGQTYIKMKDKKEKIISYNKNWSAYKNAFFYSTSKCFSCTDHFGYEADFCFGDIWLREMKNDKVKYSAIITKNFFSDCIYNKMIQENLVISTKIDPCKILKGNKRALIYKFHTADARNKVGKLFGIKYFGKYLFKSNWNHYIAALFILLNIRLSKSERIMNYIFKIPKIFMYYYMCFIRVFISF